MGKIGDKTGKAKICMVLINLIINVASFTYNALVSYAETSAGSAELTAIETDFKELTLPTQTQQPAAQATQSGGYPGRPSSTTTQPETRDYSK